MSAKIKFLLENKYQVHAFPEPVLSQKLLPNYFKKLSASIEGAPKANNGSAKRCVPIKEALSSGFIIPFWSDVIVTAKNGEMRIDFPSDLQMDTSLSEHSHEQIPDHPLSNMPYGNFPIKWHNPWIIETPKGYSCLFTSPLNHLEKRFKLFDGVVDTDTYYNRINFPFIWTGGDGEFFIEKGTPLVQVIPFKREKFSHSVGVWDHDKHKSTVAMMGTKIANSYKKLFWHRRRDD